MISLRLLPRLASTGWTLPSGGSRTPLERHRSFDPKKVGELEAAAWLAYYRRDWLRFGHAAVTLARRTFKLSWPATLICSWLVLRANQLWAPYPGNRPDRAQRAMERFYRIVQQQSGEPFEPAVAAELEVAWWRVHRDMHHTNMADGERALAEAIASLYAYVYRVPIAAVREASRDRALAMRHTDRWVQDGCRPDSPLIARARDALVRCYAALFAVVRMHDPEPQGLNTPARGIRPVSPSCPERRSDDAVPRDGEQPVSRQRPLGCPT